MPPTILLRHKERMVREMGDQHLLRGLEICVPSGRFKKHVLLVSSRQLVVSKPNTKFLKEHQNIVLFNHFWRNLIKDASVVDVRLEQIWSKLGTRVMIQPLGC